MTSTADTDLKTVRQFCVPLIELLAKETGADFKTLCADFCIDPTQVISMDITRGEKGGTRLMFTVTVKEFKTNLLEYCDSKLTPNEKAEVLKQASFMIYCARGYYEHLLKMHTGLFQRLSARVLENGGNPTDINLLKVDPKTTQLYLTENGERVSLFILDPEEK